MTTADELLGAARSLAATLAQRSPATERDRRLPAETVAELSDAELFHLRLPVELGGSGADLLAAARVSAEPGRGCGATAWVQAVLSATTAAALSLPEAGDGEAAVVAAGAYVGGERGVLVGVRRWRDEVGEHEVADPGRVGEPAEGDGVGVVVEDLLERRALDQGAHRRGPAGLVHEHVGAAGELEDLVAHAVSPEITITAAGVVTR